MREMSCRYSFSVSPLQVQIREAALKALAHPGARERLQEVGFEPDQPRMPDELMASLKSDHGRTKRLTMM